MLRREQRPDFRTVDRWATSLLLETGAIHKCDQHGWAKADRPPCPARGAPDCPEEPLAGLSPDQAVAAVREVLEGIGDTCPECP